MHYRNRRSLAPGTRSLPTALLALLALAALPACGPEDGSGDTGPAGSDTGPTMQADAGDTSGADTDGAETLRVLSVQPPKGPAAGGTQVAISGRGFAEGAAVTVGGKSAGDVTITSAYSITATTPAADQSGKAPVTVELPDGSSDTLTDAFEYTGEVQKKEVGWCWLKHPAATETTKDAPTGSIYGRVYVEGCSDGEAKCNEVAAELGYGPITGGTPADPTADSDTFRWVTATYNDGFTENDNDEYQAALDPGEAGEYAYAYRFSVDGGDSWTYCDTDEESNDFQPDKMGRLTVKDEQSDDKPIDWCKIQHPPTLELEPGEAATVFGRVRSGDCTPGADRCKGIKAQLGWGAPDTDPSSSQADYNWVDASYNKAQTGDNDEYQAALQPMNEGEFSFVYRFSGDGGTTWTYCDTNSTDDGFSTDQAGELHVEKPDPTVTIGDCNLQHPPSIALKVGTQTPTIYGRAEVPGCSDGNQECKRLTAELGWGPRGTNVSSTPGQFTWKKATYNPGHAGSRDEHQATLSPTQTGLFGYTFRFSGDGGQTWTYCDIDDTKNGFQPDQMGELKVATVSPVDIGWCRIQSPNPSMTATAAQMTPTVYGRVYVDGCTHQMTMNGNDPTVECKPVKGQLGWGPATADAMASPGKFAWTDATYNPGHTSNVNDEHQATLSAPTSPGTYRYVYRFSGDGGISWTYCDTDGTNSNGANGFDAGKSGVLNVQP